MRADQSSAWRASACNAATPVLVGAAAGLVIGAAAVPDVRFTGIVGLLLAAAAFYIGRGRQQAHFHAFLAHAWAKYAQRLDAGEDPKAAALEEFRASNLAEWTWADTKRVVEAIPR